MVPARALWLNLYQTSPAFIFRLALESGQNVQERAKHCPEHVGNDEQKDYAILPVGSDVGEFPTESIQ